MGIHINPIWEIGIFWSIFLFFYRFLFEFCLIRISKSFWKSQKQCDISKHDGYSSKESSFLIYILMMWAICTLIPCCTALRKVQKGCENPRGFINPSKRHRLISHLFVLLFLTWIEADILRVGAGYNGFFVYFKMELKGIKAFYIKSLF